MTPKATYLIETVDTLDELIGVSETYIEKPKSMNPVFSGIVFDEDMSITVPESVIELLELPYSSLNESAVGLNTQFIDSWNSALVESQSINSDLCKFANGVISFIENALHNRKITPSVGIPGLYGYKKIYVKTSPSHNHAKYPLAPYGVVYKFVIEVDYFKDKKSADASGIQNRYDSYCNYEERTIYVNAKSVSGMLDRSTFYDATYHEIMHLYDYDYKGADKPMSDDERVLYEKAVSVKNDPTVGKDIHDIAVALYYSFDVEIVANLHGLEGYASIGAASGEFYHSNVWNALVAMHTALSKLLVSVDDDDIQKVFGVTKHAVESHINRGYRKLMRKSGRVVARDNSAANRLL